MVAAALAEAVSGRVWVSRLWKDMGAPFTPILPVLERRLPAGTVSVSSN
jgi:hypothetical protein